MTGIKMPSPPDRAERDAILNDLDRCLFVEAAAGTGKTTGMVGRMIELLRHGRCTAGSMAAVTFTRKAAGELRGRFELELERRARGEAQPFRERLERAREECGRCFIGTIHSFCAHLLRERPVESGVGLEFAELDDDGDARLRRRAWDAAAARMHAENDPLLDRLAEVGLELGGLRETFDTMALYPDVTLWEAPDVPPPDTERAAGELLDFVEHIKTLAPLFPPDSGSDDLMPHYRFLLRAIRYTNLENPAELMGLLQECKKTYKLTQTPWKTFTPKPKEELARWEEFYQRVIAPAKAQWFAHRYPVALEAVRAALREYERLKSANGLLNFQDLLMKAAALLRNHPRVRGYFRSKLTHLFVDEFQDTDPIQAEAMMYLTADDPRETDWTKCRPAPGSLFVVGDPKQSIYRFRRADIVTYNQVKDIVLAAGGRVVNLSANFRANPPILEWVNRAFEGAFPAEANAHSPVYTPLQPGRPAGTDSQSSVERLSIPAHLSKKDDILVYESNQIALVIKRLVEEEGYSPDDFLIVNYNTKELGRYAEALQRHGIPHQIAGGALLSELEELRLLGLALDAALEPDNPLAMVAVLRSALYGISDADLYAFRLSGGEFTHRFEWPEALRQPFPAIREAFEATGRHAVWLRRYPPAAAAGLIIQDLGLSARASAGEQCAHKAGGLLKAVELIREAAGKWTVSAEMREYLGELTDPTSKSNEHNLIPAGAAGGGARIMNLHKVKGLEGKVVFLANPTGAYDHEPHIHISRGPDGAAGYLRIRRPVNDFGHFEVEAQPLEWESRAAEEKRFLDAEATRLLYVAATRAEARLIVSVPETTNQRVKNPWAFFVPFLEEAPQAAAGEAVAVSSPSAEESAVEALAEDLRKVETDWRELSISTYSIRSARDMAEPEPEAGIHVGGGPGAQWGTAIHRLLRWLVLYPHDPAEPAAKRFCAEAGLDEGKAAVALETARRFMESGLWRRVMESPEVHTEIPFQTPLDTGTGTLVRGAVDLAFREGGGWVIVDHKTDAGAADRAEAAAERHRPQVETYKAHWEGLSGEAVVETGLYFTAIHRYVPL